MRTPLKDVARTGINWGGDLPCGGHMELNGAAFVDGENPPTTGCGDCYAKHEEKIRRVVRTAARVSTKERPIYTSCKSAS